MGLNCEPDIKVRIYTSGAPLLIPLGEYDIRPEGGNVVYAPMNGKSRMILENQTIGVGFHWQQSIRTLLEGRFEVTAPHWTLYNILPLERYLISVTGSEMNPEAPLEFLKAHSVIARSWLLGGMGKRHQDCNVCSDDCCQRYQGFADIEQNNAVKAVIETRGVVLLDRAGNIADTRYSKSCGGHTELFSTCWEDMDFDYLPTKPDPWCNLEDMNETSLADFATQVFKSYDRSTGILNGWKAVVDKADLREKIRKEYGRDIGFITGMTALHRGPSGRIYSLLVEGSKGNVTISKELAIRRILGDPCLYSSAFCIEDSDAAYLLSGRGWGHGVGLCQTGAARMAMNGHDFMDILNFYYPNTTLTRIYE